MNMVEKVAEVIAKACEVRSFGCYDFSKYPGSEPPHQVKGELASNSNVYFSYNTAKEAKDKYDELTKNFIARAAIEAMRVPSEEMTNAGGEKSLRYLGADEALGHEGVLDTYQSMIDAALKE